MKISTNIWTTPIDRNGICQQRIYKFFCKIEGCIGDATEMSAGGERIVRHNFNVTLNGYLIHEYVANIINKKRKNLKKTLTRGKVKFSENIE